MKPLNCKNYGSIGHLIGSKVGESDSTISAGQHRICTEKLRDKNDLLIVTEKYDGSNVGVCRVNNKIYAITRAGYLAETSAFEQHIYFSKWVKQNERIFYNVLSEGERICGEWLLSCHSLKYNFSDNVPFLAFDIFDRNNTRINYDSFRLRILGSGIKFPRVLWYRNEPLSIEHGLYLMLQPNTHTVQTEIPEGFVYRVERKGKVDFLAKYVRPDFETGKYMKEGIYNINPELIKNVASN